MSLLNKEKMLEVAKQFVDEGRLDRAVKEYEKIIIAEPEDLRVRIMLAEIQVRRKKIVEAIAIYREIAEKYELDGFYLKAVTIYKNIIKLNPSLIEINEKLAILYHKMGLIADSVRQYEILSVSLEQQGSWNEILEVRRKIVDLKPDDGNARVRLAEVYQRQGMLEDAIDQYEVYASQLEKAGDEKRLLDMYERILPHREGNKDMLKRVIELSYKLGDVKKSLKWLEGARNIADSDEFLLGLKAKIYASFNQLETARNHYLMLADLLIEKGKNEDAIKIYEEVLYIDPGEEQNIKQKVKELSPNEWENVKTRIFARRKKEEEESEKEEEEDTKSGSAVVVEEKQTKQNIQEVASREKMIKTPAVDLSAISRAMDGAMSLGNTYFKMGLLDEAKSEFLSAKEKIIILSKHDSSWQKKIVEIDKLLKQCEKSNVSVKTNNNSYKRENNKNRNKPAIAGEIKKTNNSSKNKSKKKISFV